ncbi:hypothetical protein QE152_g29536 [Popillia japonica]|uniref:Uncharacterized protein n=1 Tax=Popillia japonica TaxID=7064 RepID=A0AAW1JHZ3_POPJA
MSTCTEQRCKALSVEEKISTYVHIIKEIQIRKKQSDKDKILALEGTNKNVKRLRKPVAGRVDEVINEPIIYQLVVLFFKLRQKNLQNYSTTMNLWA